ncbi:MAG: MerR family transcriptional regulator [Betaproteobacteria bacterium]|nr:MerR family transcriptional regulator [Betaproteobacteria bacterium]
MKSDDAPQTHSLDELAALVDLPKRTVRYYIQLGLVDRPDGETRAARYGTRHVEQLLQVRKWSDAGVSLERIRELLSGEAPPVPPRPRAAGTVELWSHLVIAEGLELSMEAGRAELTPDETRELFNGVMALYRNIKNKGNQP